MRSLMFLALSLSVSAYTVSSVPTHCDSLYSFTGDGGLEAPTSVKKVTYVAPNVTTGVPAYCSVLAEIESIGGITKMVTYLPAEGHDWVGTFVSHGCGGSCGAMGLDYVYGYGTPLGYGRDALKKGFVITSNDMGHDNADTGDTLSSWGAFRNNRTNEINFAYLSTHLSAVSNKAMIQFYYGTPLKRSIFRGGSTGGRQAFISAARYPHDFDGIIAAYGAVNETGIGGLQYAYYAQVSRFENGTQILTLADLYSLNAGALAACDANDGLVDGFIDLSYRCSFDPVTILCSMKTLRTSGGCLANMDKVRAARAMYGYPSNSFSKKLIPARYTPGSELGWAMWTTDGGVDFAESFCQNAAFQEDLPTNWTVAEYDWYAHPYQLGYMEDLYTADFHGLRTFRQRGGKILHYQGWADASVAPGWTVQLYQDTIDEIGLKRTTEFQRFFVYPGMAHIDIHSTAKGTVGWRSDYYETLNRWLDTGVAPDRLVVELWNMTTGATIEKRPYFAYPKTPKYVAGKAGGPSDVNNWVGVVPPKARRGQDYPWTG